MTIRDLLAEKGLSIDTLAQSIGVDSSTLSDYEAGRAEPSEEVLAAIKEACGGNVCVAAPSEEADLTTEKPADEVEGADDAGETAGNQAAGEKAVEKEADEEAMQIAGEEEAAKREAERIAAEEKAARKAAKKAAKKQKADEEAARWVAEAIRALGDGVDLDDEDAVIAARDALDSLTDDQEQLIPGDLLSMLVAAEQMIEDASRTFPIEDCWITVKDVPYTGKKIKKPSVKIECGDMKLKEGEDFTFSYDKKVRDIGLYTLTIEGMDRFTGFVDVPFCVVPKAKALIKMMGGAKKASLDWKRLKHIKGYQIEYSRDEDFSDSKKAKIQKTKDLEKLIGKLKPGKKYHVRVRIYAKIGKEKCYSDWSKAVTLKL